MDDDSRVRVTYFSGCTAPRYEQDIIDLGVGLLIQPGSYAPRRVGPFASWAADNACYPPDNDPRRKVPWRAADWCRMLGAIDDLDDEKIRSRCRFVLVPDVPFSNEGTMRRWDRYWLTVASFELPLAFAIQDGATIESVPWDCFEVAFLAGSDDWKLGDGAYEMAHEARRRGKWVHMGRVNSWARLDWASTIGCDSADGTFMRHGKPAEMVARLKVWLDNDSPRLTQRSVVFP